MSVYLWDQCEQELLQVQRSLISWCQDKDSNPRWGGCTDIWQSNASLLTPSSWYWDHQKNPRSLQLVLKPFTMCDFAIQNHRITELFGLEELKGTFTDHLVQPPCNGKGHLPLEKVAQSPIHLGLERSQGWGLHKFSGQSAWVPYHPHYKNLFFMSKSNLMYFSLKLLPLALSLQALVKRGLSYKPPLYNILKVHNKVSLERFHLQAEQIQQSQPLIKHQIVDLYFSPLLPLPFFWSS